MTFRAGAVTVKQLPEALNVKLGRIFSKEIETCMNIDRPRIVLDCSKVRHMDRTVIHLLLCCLEEAMKRNGDVKLAAIPPEAEEILQLTGVARLFQIFDTITDAVSSFHHLRASAASHASVRDLSHQSSESVA